MVNLSVYSKNRIMETFKRWDVPMSFAEPMFNYLVHGFNPGSCFTGVLANDFSRAIQSSHPHNSLDAFKALNGWIFDIMPPEAFGSYTAVDKWTSINDVERRKKLENFKLVYNVEDEAIMILSGVDRTEPVLLN